MTRKLWVLGIVAVLGVSLAIAGVSNTLRASACDDTNKSAAATPSCCAKDGAKTAAVDANKVHNSMIKSAMVAPGAAPILNVAAMGGMLASDKDCPPCDWCPGTTASASACNASMSASDCAAHMSSSECTAHMSQAAGAGAEKCPFMAQQNAAVTADMKGGCPHAANASVASVEQGGCSASMKTAHEGCTGSMATVASTNHECSQSMAAMAGHDGCTGAKTASAAGGAGCCGEKSASAAMKENCNENQNASLKGVVDDMPYKENKRVTLAGSYACGHCTLQKTEACAPMLKTADGKIYPLLKTARASELKAAEGKNIEVSGTVKKVDGVKFLEVKSYKVL